MLGIAVSTDLNNRTSVFLYYTEAHKDREDENLSHPVEPIGNRVYRYDLLDNRLVNPKLLLNLPAMPGPRHMGGVIAIGPDNNLYVSVGDLDGTFRGKKYDTMAQNYLNSTILDGRSGILRMNQDGKRVGEGILGSTFPLNLYYAYGIRNNFGFDWDPLRVNYGIPKMDHIMATKLTLSNLDLIVAGLKFKECGNQILNRWEK